MQFLEDQPVQATLVGSGDGDLFVFPVSFAQQRLWFLDQFEPGSPFYNIPVALRIRGQLDTDILQQAVNSIVERHEVLRTTFDSQDGEPVQIVWPHLRVPLPVADLRVLPVHEREREALRLANEEAKRPFDLQQGPLLRGRLYQIADEEHIALFIMHHIISDGWSISVMVREVAALYAAFNAGLPSPLELLPIQYADFACWQREWLQGEVLQQQLDYWTEQLGQDPPVLELPTDRPRPAVQSSRGATLARQLSPALAQALRGVARETGTTLFMQLLAAFHVLLYRYTNQEVINVGSPIANRNSGEVEGLIGFFANTLVFKAELDGTMSFVDLLAQVKDSTLGAYANQDLPFEMLVDALQVERDMSHSPLFQVMFILQNIPTGSLDLPGVSMQTVDVETGTSTFDVTLMVAEADVGLHVSVEYNTDLFNRSTMARFLAHYEVLLDAISQNPQQPIARLPLLSIEEQQLLLQTWNNDTAALPAITQCVHQLFERQAAASPEATAVVWQAERLSYDELNERANRLAHYLRAQGAGPETLVAVSLERSLEMIVAVLGVLKAGAAFVPLNPLHPSERLAFMLGDSGAPILLTQQSLLEADIFGDGTDARQVVCLDRDWAQIVLSPATNPENYTAREHLAYMIYTSGSTGQAKGVLVEHRNLVSAYLAWEQSYELHAVSSHLQMADFSFDVFCGDLVRALLSGGKLVLCPREWLLAPAKLYGVLRQEQVDIAEFVPAVLRQLMQYVEQYNLDLSFMRFLICGSDSWYAGEYKAFQRLLGAGTLLVNSFGLTEATIDSAYFAADGLELEADQIVPIGRPFANTRLYILDEYRQPVPIGVPGELYVGGEAVTRGYHRRPLLTAERFLPDPFGDGLSGHDHQVARLYKSGDLARFLPDGNIEFLGRIDQQVKIRGFRIEPGEIEAALLQHEAVQSAVVRPATAPGGETRLAAYVVGDERESLTGGVLRRFLQERVPDYMIPAAFLLLDELPLLPNGKIDRRSLPEPDWSERSLETDYVAPRTATERRLVGLWQAVLGKEEVGIHDNFFELGGHSLLATQLVSRVREAFSIEMPLRQIFEAPTVASQAERVEIASRGAPGMQAPPIRPAARDGEMPLSYAQQRLWFLDQLEPDSAFYNIPEAVRLLGELDVEVLARCLNEVVQRHEVLRTIFITVDGKPLQRILPTLEIPLPVVDLTDLPPAEREARALELVDQDAGRPFALDQGPLLRAQLIRMGENDHVFAATLHHIISDAWSTGVFIGEVAVLYDAFSSGQLSPLPELRIQYADFAKWQRDWLQGEVLGGQLAYWREQLAGSEPLELAADRPRPPVQTFNGDYLTAELPAALTTQIRRLCQQEGVTPFMLLLAAFQTLLYRYTHQDGINVGTPIANRNKAEIEGLIGFFINTLVLRADFSDEPTFRELLQRTREASLGAYAHQDVPFEMVVDALQPERDLSRPPLFQVMLVLQNLPLQQVQRLPDLELRPFEAHTGAAKFDLTLFVTEDDERFGAAWEYNTDLFDASTIERMAGHFAVLLESIVADPDLPVSRLPVLPAAERERVLVEWNETAASFPRGQCVHELFVEQVARTPEAAAVRLAEQTLSYAELNRRANQLAHHLRRRGVGPEVLVGIFMERSIDMLVGILGTLKAGGAYLPLDPSYPAERLAFMLGDAQPAVVLTQAALVGDDLPPERTLVVDREWPAIAAEPADEPAQLATPENLAYVIYTSGSTGKPKGTMLIHRGLVNYLTWCRQAYPLDRGSGSLVHSSISFDLTITGLFAPLLSGRCVHLLPEGQDVAGLAEVLRAVDALSVVKITPAHLELLSAQIPAAEAGGRTWGFVIGGENLVADSLRFWQAHAPQTALFNEYGPTETVVGCCVYKVEPGERLAGPVPIGRPIINTQLYILDKHGQPVPVGVPGELYIGGVQVARGYLNRPELTAEKFIPDPFGADPQGRLYRTGDLCRYRGDGTIEFLGRLDDQVKIHGYRIELGEIEAVLSEHPALRKVAVVDRVDERGHKRLVAYCVPADEAPATEVLRAFLEETLPAYMVPAAFVMLDALPLTRNGKVDRRALPEPGTERPELAVAYAPPQDEREEILVAIWQGLLQVERIGIHDNFFALGGDSILIIQMVARAKEAGLQLTPRQVFQQPTIAGLAAIAGQGPEIEAEQGLVSGSVPLTPIQHWFFEQDIPHRHHWNQSLMMSVAVRLDTTLLSKAVARLLEHHDALRLRYQWTDGELQQVHVAPDGEIPYEYFNLSGEPGELREEKLGKLAAGVQTSLDLARGPLIRVAYIDYGSEHRGRLLIAVHHLVVDAYSWTVLLQDLQTAYSQLSQNEPVRLPRKSSAFKAWAERLTAYAQSDAALEEAAYWLAEATDARLPRDFDAVGTNTEQSAESVTVALSAGETERLLHHVHEPYRTDVQDLLLTALVQTVAEWTGVPAARINLEGHGREDLFDDLDLSRTVGWFTALYPLQLTLPEGGRLGDALLAVKEQVRAVPLSGISYGLLRYVRTGEVSGRLERLQSPEISFNYLGQMDRAADTAAVFGPANDSAGPARDPLAARTHLLEIDGAIASGRLQLEWTYSTNLHRRDTIETLAASYMRHLRALIDHCSSPEAGGISPSDVADFGWDADDLSDILGAIEE